MKSSSKNLRTHDSFLKHPQKARTRPKHVSCGVKGLSVLTMLACFCCSSGFAVDYMHAVCSGFVKATAMLWQESEKCRGFKIRRRLEEVSAKLIGMSPTWELSRLSRPLSESKRWKSSEWRNWLLFYSPIILPSYIPSRNFQNWMKFVQMMHCMLAPKISLETISLLKTGMRKFLKEYELLYGKQNMSYNAHLFIHLVDSIKEWGPLWGYSLYPFDR